LVNLQNGNTRRSSVPDRWRLSGTLTLCLTVLAGSAAHAQDAPVAPTPTVVIPALTPVELEIMADLSSRTAKSGQLFPLRLAEPVVIDGRVLIPAGALGEGEVLDAKRAGMGGSGGILTLIAHTITVNGRTLRLRSMHLAQNGADHRTAAFVTSQFVPIAGLFVTGGQTQVASGTRAEAKTAEDFAFEDVKSDAITTEGTNR
jgi:hypothetical protein